MSSRSSFKLKDTVALTAETVGKPTLKSDSLRVRIDTLATHRQKRVKHLASIADPAAAMPTLRPVLAEAQELGARAILTTDPWATVPERIEAPRQIFGPDGGRPPRPSSHRRTMKPARIHCKPLKTNALCRGTPA
jgi:hypothetical protein